MTDRLRRQATANPNRRTWRDESDSPELLRVDEPMTPEEAEDLKQRFLARRHEPPVVMTAPVEHRWADLDGSELVHPERRKRTREEWALLWAKSVSWRAISTGTLFLVAWLYTGDAGLGGVVAMIHMVITIVIYVPHDLAWERYSARRELRRRRRSTT